MLLTGALQIGHRTLRERLRAMECPLRCYYGVLDSGDFLRVLCG
jgi:hypothetical protein